MFCASAVLFDDFYGQRFSFAQCWNDHRGDDCVLAGWLFPAEVGLEVLLKCRRNLGFRTGIKKFAGSFLFRDIRVAGIYLICCCSQ